MSINLSSAQFKVFHVHREMMRNEQPARDFFDPLSSSFAKNKLWFASGWDRNINETAISSTSHSVSSFRRELEGRPSRLSRGWSVKGEDLSVVKGERHRSGMAGSKETEEVVAVFNVETTTEQTRLSPVFRVSRTGYHRSFVLSRFRSVFYCCYSWIWLVLCDSRRRCWGWGWFLDEPLDPSFCSQVGAFRWPRANLGGGIMRVLDNLYALGYVTFLLLLVGESLFDNDDHSSVFDQRL